MKEVRAEFKQRIERMPTVVSFRMWPEEKVDFLPGQFMEVIFEKQDNELRHFLSFSSSPLRDYIEFTKRLSQSKFSQKLKKLIPGDKVLLRLPFGDCVYKEEYKKIGFIIGGIGITPVISILEYIVDKNLNTDCFLIYSNKSEEGIAFKEELDRWSKEINLKVLYLVTEGEPKSSGVRKGFISYDFLFDFREEFQERVNFLFGPPEMVNICAEILRQLGIEGQKVKRERFIGY